MENYFSVLENCILFEGISQSDLSGLLACLGARTAQYKKGSVIWQEGDPALYIGIVLSGAVQIIREDFYGNRSIVTQVEQADLFCESFAAGKIRQLPVSIIAPRDCTVMIIECDRITVGCSNACGFHSRMINNLLQVMANKNLQYNQKMDILSRRTTREKLLAYLMSQAKQAGSNRFTIPYDRQALADYLGVERSAMSAEISKLKRDGILECRKSEFTLL